MTNLLLCACLSVLCVCVCLFVCTCVCAGHQCGELVSWWRPSGLCRCDRTSLCVADHKESRQEEVSVCVCVCVCVQALIKTNFKCDTCCLLNVRFMRENLTG